MLLKAVKRCWASLWTARAIAYRARQGISAEEVALAVVVQQLVPAEVAGVLFTANPLTGSRQQSVINAAWGLGEAIVGGLVTPDTLVVNKQTGEIESSEIADKTTMTVCSLDGTREEAVPDDRRRRPALDPDRARELANLGEQIEQLYGCPMDIEWALCQGRLFILQARPITALPEPPPTLDWTLPREKGKYARASVIELLPEPLSPLFATLALPHWNLAYRRLMGEVGMSRMLPESYLVTINDYAYYDASDFGAWGMIRALPRLIPRAFDWMRSAYERWADEARPRHAAVVGAWAVRELSETSATELLEGAGQIIRSEADHYLTIQSGVLPVAYMSEAVFTRFYQKVIKRKDDPSALVFLLGFDSTPILAEKSLYDLAEWARCQSELAAYLECMTGTQLAVAYQADSSPLAGGESWNEFRRRLAEHLDRFGHAVYDLDFAKGLAADEPAPVLEALRYFLGGQARSPHERQAMAAEEREQATQFLLGRLKGLRRRWFLGLMRRAQRYAPLRENALADVGLGWPMVRRMVREVGRRLVAAGGMVDRDDVFWLTRDELKAAARAMDENRPVEDHRRVVVERRADVAAPANGDAAGRPARQGGCAFLWNRLERLDARAIGPGRGHHDQGSERQSGPSGRSGAGNSGPCRVRPDATR